MSKTLKDYTWRQFIKAARARGWVYVSKPYSRDVPKMIKQTTVWAYTLDGMTGRLCSKGHGLTVGIDKNLIIHGIIGSQTQAKSYRVALEQMERIIEAYNNVHKELGDVSIL